jgi:hypothetical protein
VIDAIWLRRIIAYSGADTGGYDADHLAMLLEDQAEVLPYLILRGRGFANWPKARTALARAAASAPRVRAGDAIGAQPPLSEFRTELYEGIRDALLASATNRPPVVAKPAGVVKPAVVRKPKTSPEPAGPTAKAEPKRRPEPEPEPETELGPTPDPVAEKTPRTVEETLGAIRRIRFDEARAADSPSMFISRPEAPESAARQE